MLIKLINCEFSPIIKQITGDKKVTFIEIRNYSF